jgi:hypothetical protein
MKPLAPVMRIRATGGKANPAGEKFFYLVSGRATHEGLRLGVSGGAAG